jgi:glycosyltransferase involved in cell wall biosynthesis
MVAYKGVHNFLGYLKENGLENDYSILIIGKFADEKYYLQLKQLSGTKTKIENRFAGMDELINLVYESHFVLFTYSDSSVLSSGALMDTLAMGAGIIGPDTGAFSDLAEEGIIRVYKDFSDIKEIYNNPDLSLINPDAQYRFLIANTWEAAGKKIGGMISVSSRQSAFGSRLD